MFAVERRRSVSASASRWRPRRPVSWLSVATQCAQLAVIVALCALLAWRAAAGNAAETQQRTDPHSEQVLCAILNISYCRLSGIPRSDLVGGGCVCACGVCVCGLLNCLESRDTSHHLRYDSLYVLVGKRCAARTAGGGGSRTRAGQPRPRIPFPAPPPRRNCERLDAVAATAEVQALEISTSWLPTTSISGEAVDERFSAFLFLSFSGLKQSLNCL